MDKEISKYSLKSRLTFSESHNECTVNIVIKEAVSKSDFEYLASIIV